MCGRKILFGCQNGQEWSENDLHTTQEIVSSFNTFFLMILLLYTKLDVHKQNHMMKSFPKPKNNDKNVALVPLNMLYEAYPMLSCR